MICICNARNCIIFYEDNCWSFEMKPYVFTLVQKWKLCTISVYINYCVNLNGLSESWTFRRGIIRDDKVVVGWKINFLHSFVRSRRLFTEIYIYFKSYVCGRHADLYAFFTRGHAHLPFQLSWIHRRLRTNCDNTLNVYGETIISSQVFCIFKELFEPIVNNYLHIFFVHNRCISPNIVTWPQYFVKISCLTFAYFVDSVWLFIG